MLTLNHGKSFPQIEYTDYGAESEVVCMVDKPTNVVTAMAREAKGTAIVSVPLEVSDAWSYASLFQREGRGMGLVAWHN